MDIAALSTVMSQSKIRENAGIMILKKIQTTAEQDGQAVREMIAKVDISLAEPHLGKNIDKYV